MSRDAAEAHYGAMLAEAQRPHLHTFSDPLSDGEPHKRRCACGQAQRYNPPDGQNVIERFFHADNPLAEPDMRLLQITLPAAREAVTLRKRVQELEALTAER